MVDASPGDALVNGSEETQPLEGRAMAEWPFIGRDDELRLLRGLITGDECRSVVVAGAAGVGKTRLAIECLRLAERAGLATLRTAATRSAAALPLDALTPLLVDDGDRPGPVDDRSDLVRRVAANLMERAGARSLVLFVDDAHLLDDASATLIHHLVTTGAACVLITVPTGMRVPDPVVALWRDGIAERLDLRRLPEEVIGEILTAVVGGPLDPATVAELAVRAQGNVLFLRELVIGAVWDSSLVLESGLWRLRGALRPSNRLVELVEARLQSYGLTERALLELVSYGEPLGHAELAELVDPLLAESLERQGILSSKMNGRRLEVRFAHPLYGEVVRSRIPAVRARAIARALAEAVEATGARRREDALRVASWRLIGGGGDPEVMLAGATAARWRYDFELAERLARAAVDLQAGFDAALLAAELARLQGRTQQADRELAALAVEAVQTGDDAQRGRVALARADLLSWTRPEDLRLLEAAEAAIRDPAWRDRLAARRLAALFYTQGPRAVVEAAAPLLERAEGPALAHACIHAAFGLCRLGRLDEALEVAARGHAAQVAASEPVTWYKWWHVMTRGRALFFAGRFDEASAEAEAHYRQALDEGSIEAQANFALVPAFVVAERGRVETSARMAATALALGRDLGWPVMICLGYAYQALALALGGRAAEAAQAIAACDALSVPVPRHSDVDLLQVRAWTVAAAGDLPGAREHLERAALLANEVGDVVGEASALHGQARMGRARQVRDRLATVTGLIDGGLAPARLRHTDALARNDMVQLEAVSHEFETMGADLLAAEAAADAALSLRQAGEPRAAAFAERRARTLADRCEGAATPALQAIEARSYLTATERETALLAAAGRTNKQIAAELNLSVRTVENRLHRVYGKLGISGRSELAQSLVTK